MPHTQHVVLRKTSSSSAASRAFATSTLPLLLAALLLVVSSTGLLVAVDAAVTPSPPGATVYDCSSTPPFIIDNVVGTVHFRIDGTAPAGGSCRYILRCALPAPYWLLYYGTDNTASGSWFGGSAITPMPKQYWHQARVGLVVDTSPNTVTDIIAECVPRACTITQTDPLFPRSVPLTLPRTPGEFCLWDATCPLGQHANIRLRLLDNTASFGTTLPITAYRGLDHTTSPVAFPVPEEPESGAQGQNAVDIVMEHHETRIVLDPLKLDRAMALTVMCLTEKCPYADPTETFHGSRWTGWALTYNYKRNSTLLAGDCPVKFACDPVYSQQPIVSVLSSTCRTVTSTCPEAIADSNTVFEGFATPPCGTATVRVPRDITKVTCDTRLSVRCKSICSSPNATTPVHELNIGDVMWFAVDADGRFDRRRVAPFSECQFKWRCRQTNANLVVNVTGSLNQLDSITVYQNTFTYLVGVAGTTGFDNVPIPIGTREGALHYRSSVKLDSDKDEERLPGPGMSMSVECKPVSSITCPPLGRTIVWAQEGVYQHYVDSKRPVTDQCSWQFRCPAGMYPGVFFQATQAYGSGMFLSVRNSDGTTRSAVMTSIIFGDTSEVTVDLTMRGLTSSTKGFYSLDFDCYVARCHLNSTKPVEYNMTAWEYSYESERKYSNNTPVLDGDGALMSIPGTHVNEVDCLWIFRCPATTPFLGFYASGYVGPNMTVELEDDDKLGTYHPHFWHANGADFGYLMPGAGVRIRRTTLTSHFDAHSFSMRIDCFVRRCTNNHTEDARLVLPASGGPNEMPEFRYYIHEECPMRLTCQNEDHYLGISAGMFLRADDMVWGQDTTFPIPYTFEWPKFPNYGDEGKKGDHAVRAGFLYRTNIVQMWLNTTMRDPETTMLAGRFWDIRGFCFQSLCGNNNTDAYQANTKHAREETSFLYNADWGLPQFVNTHCTYHLECPIGSFATVRYDVALAGTPALFYAGNFRAEGTGLYTNAAYRSEDHKLTVAMQTPVPQHLTRDNDLLNQLGLYVDRGFGMSILFGCAGDGAECIQENTTSAIEIPSQIPNVVPFITIIPKRVRRYAAVVFEFELCQWYFRCPSPNMYLMVAKSVGTMRQDTANEDVNITAIDQANNPLWGVAAGPDLINLKAGIFLNQSEGILLTLFPRKSQHLELRIDVRCYISPCCNNLTQPVLLNESSPDHLLRPWGALVPKPMNNTACDGTNEKQRCDWVVMPCNETGRNRLLTYPHTNFSAGLYPRHNDSDFAGGTTVSRLSRGEAHYSYDVPHGAQVPIELSFHENRSLAMTCSPCNATSVGSENVLELFTQSRLEVPHWCNHELTCPAGKAIRLEMMDSPWSTLDRFINFTVDNVTYGNELPLGTRITYSDYVNDTSPRNRVHFGYHGSPDPAMLKYGSALMVRYKCEAEACDVPNRRSYVEERTTVMPAAQALIGNQVCDWTIDIDCKSKCETHFWARLQSDWPLDDFMPQLNTTRFDFEAPQWVPNLTIASTTSGEPSWTPPEALKRPRLTSKIFHEKIRMAVRITTTRASLMLLPYRSLPAVIIDSDRSSVSLSLPLTESTSLTESLNVSGTESIVPTDSVSPTFSDPVTGTETVSLTESPSTSTTSSISESISLPITESISISETGATDSLPLTISDSLSESFSPTRTLSTSESTSLSSSLSESLSSTQSMSETTSLSESISESPSESASSSMTESSTMSDSESLTIVMDPYVTIEPPQLNQDVIAKAYKYTDEERTIIFKPLGEKFDPVWTIGREFGKYDLIFDRVRIWETSTKRTGFMASANQAWHRLAIKSWNETMMVCVLGATPSYFSLRDDDVHFEFAPELFAIRHYNVTQPRLRLTKPYRGWLGQDVKDATEVMGAIAAGFSGIAGMQAARSSALVALDGCENPLEQPLPPTEYPLGIPVTDRETRYLIGCMLLNPACIIAFAVLHAVITQLVCFVRRAIWGADAAGGFIEAAAVTRFPNLVAIPALFLVGPSITAAASVVLHDESAKWRAIGVVVNILWLGIPASVAYLTLSRDKFRAVAVDETDLYAGDTIEVFIKGRYTWRDDIATAGDKATGFCRRFSLYFNPYKPSRRWFLVIEILTSYCVAYVSSIKPDDGNCSGVAVALLVIYILYLVALIALSPYITPIEMALIFAMALLGTAGYAFAIMAHVSPSRFHMLLPASAMFSVLLIYLAMALVIFDILGRVHDVWKKRQEKKAIAAKRDLAQPLLNAPPTAVGSPKAAGGRSGASSDDRDGVLPDSDERRSGGGSDDGPAAAAAADCSNGPGAVAAAEASASAAPSMLLMQMDGGEDVAPFAAAAGMGSGKGLPYSATNSVATAAAVGAPATAAAGGRHAAQKPAGTTSASSAAAASSAEPSRVNPLIQMLDSSSSSSSLLGSVPPTSDDDDDEDDSSDIPPPSDDDDDDRDLYASSTSSGGLGRGAISARHDPDL